MGNYEVAFTAKGFAMFVEALTGKIISGAETTPVVQLTPPQDEEKEIDGIVAQWTALQNVKDKIAIDKPTSPVEQKPYTKTSPYNKKPRSSKIKEAARVYNYLAEHAMTTVRLSELCRYMSSQGYSGWTTKRATMMIQDMMSIDSRIVKIGYGLYGVERVEVPNEV